MRVGFNAARYAMPTLALHSEIGAGPEQNCLDDTAAGARKARCSLLASAATIEEGARVATYTANATSNETSTGDPRSDKKGSKA